MNAGKKIKRLIGNIYAFLFHRRKVETMPCDILFLVFCPVNFKRIKIERTKKLKTALQEGNDYHVCYEVVSSASKIMLNRLLVKIERMAPFLYCYMEYYAAYIIKKYQPKILLTFQHGSVSSFFLKKEMEKIGGRNINIAHGMMTNNKFEIFDSHYYFVFGQYSIDRASRQKTRYGSTKLVKTGSFLIDEEFTLPVNREFKKILFFSSWVKKEFNGFLAENFNLLAKWAKVQKKYHLVIKHHPLEDESIIRSVFKGIPNVTFLPKATNMKDTLRDVSLVLACGSTASLEAALLNRPSVMILYSDGPHFPELEEYYNELEKYFLPRTRTVEEIQDRIEETFARYDYFLERSKEYVQRHLEHTTDSIPFMAHCIKSIYDGKEDFESVPIEGTEGVGNYFAQNG